MSGFLAFGNWSGNRCHTMRISVNRLPFSVAAFPNKSGSNSFRVTGSWAGERIRKNFADHAEAVALCNAKNAAALASQTASETRLVQTRLTDPELRAAENAREQSRGRWELREIVAAGVAALESTPQVQPLAPLAVEWIDLMESQVSRRWHRDLRARVSAFVNRNPTLSTASFTRAAIRADLDGLDVAPQTKANHRNALHRFAGWLVERGFCRVNPAAGIRIAKSRLAAGAELQMPAVLSPEQAAAFMRAMQLAECRRLLGWAALCLFAGLRPESEAPRAAWAEIDLSAEQMHVLGRKRGAKPRTFRLPATACAWLRLARADRMAIPGTYLVKVRRRAVELANEFLREEGGEPLVWSGDVLRHSFASYRAGAGVALPALADEMGTSPRVIYAHYRTPRTPAQVAAFWAVRPG